MFLLVLVIYRDHLDTLMLNYIDDYCQFNLNNMEKMDYLFAGCENFYSLNYEIYSGDTRRRLEKESQNSQKTYFHTLAHMLDLIFVSFGDIL